MCLLKTLLHDTLTSLRQAEELLLRYADIPRTGQLGHRSTTAAARLALVDIRGAIAMLEEALDYFPKQPDKSEVEDGCMGSTGVSRRGDKEV